MAGADFVKVIETWRSCSSGIALLQALQNRNVIPDKNINKIFRTGFKLKLCPFISSTGPDKDRNKLSLFKNNPFTPIKTYTYFTLKEDIST